MSRETSKNFRRRVENGDFDNFFVGQGIADRLRGVVIEYRDVRKRTDGNRARGGAMNFNKLAGLVTKRNKKKRRSHNGQVKEDLSNLIDLMADEVCEALTDMEDVQLALATNSDTFNLITREIEKRAKRILRNR